MYTLWRRRGDRRARPVLLGILQILAILLAFPLTFGVVSGHVGSSEANLVAVDFEEVDLRIFIKFVSEVTGRVFLLDDRVQGRASIRFANRIPVDQLYDVLESVLEVKGYAAVPAGSITKIVPLGTVKQRGIEVRGQEFPHPSGRP